VLFRGFLYIVRTLFLSRRCEWNEGFSLGLRFVTTYSGLLGGGGLPGVGEETLGPGRWVRMTSVVNQRYRSALQRFVDVVVDYSVAGGACVGRQACS